MPDVLDLKDRSAVNRAVKAQALLSDPELIEAFSAVRESLLARFEACPIRDIEGQHEIKLMLKLLNDVRANLQSVVNTGKVIEYRISMLEKAKKGLTHALRR